MSTRYKGSIMAATAVTSSTFTAKGIWRSNEVMQGIQAIAWPGFITPSVDYLVVAGGGAGGGGNPSALLAPA